MKGVLKEAGYAACRCSSSENPTVEDQHNLPAKSHEVTTARPHCVEQSTCHVFGISPRRRPRFKGSEHFSAVSSFARDAPKMSQVLGVQRQRRSSRKIFAIHCRTRQTPKRMCDKACRCTSNVAAISLRRPMWQYVISRNGRNLSRRPTKLTDKEHREESSNTNSTFQCVKCMVHNSPRTIANAARSRSRLLLRHS